MSQEAQEILQKALLLPDNERAELAGSLIASLDEVTDEDSEAAWQEEIARRAKEFRSGKAATTSWSEVQLKARTLLDARLGLHCTSDGR